MGNKALSHREKSEDGRGTGDWKKSRVGSLISYRTACTCLFETFPGLVELVRARPDAECFRCKDWVTASCASTQRTVWRHSLCRIVVKFYLEVNTVSTSKKLMALYTKRQLQHRVNAAMTLIIQLWLKSIKLQPHSGATIFVSIVFKETNIASTIAAMTLHWRWSLV